MVILCDICNRDTEGFYYWENLIDALGVKRESYLDINICESCAESIRYDIPSKLMRRRYDDTLVNQLDTDEQVKKWRDIILSNKHSI